jgi:hypothetical protein
MTEMTRKQQETFGRLTHMVALYFNGVGLVPIRGALRLAMKDWEAGSGKTVSEAEKWPFERYLNECCIPALNNFVERLTSQGYDRKAAREQLEKLIDKVRESYGEKEK